MGRTRKNARSPVSLFAISPAGFVDLHSHVLPGVDDGAVDSSEALAMLDGLAALGYAAVVATPHREAAHGPGLDADWAARFDELARKRGTAPPALRLGAEVLFDDAFLAAEREGLIPRIGAGRVYLVEFGFQRGGIPRGAEESAFRFQVRGGTLVLAHPERFADLQQEPARVDLLRRAGMLLQVDALSLVGECGAPARRLAWELIEDKKADIVATDIHRPDDLGLIEGALTELAHWSADELVRLAATNPRLVLDGQVEGVVRRA